MDYVLSKLERFGISKTGHGQTSLLAHLQGTHNILQAWESPSYVCLAGLCHSIYGTESFSKTPVTLDNREYVRNLIGEEAERLAYLFGAHVKETFWKNLDLDSGYSIDDRFTKQAAPISAKDLADIITVTLANWLEQRPRSDPKYQFIRQDEFVRSRAYLPERGYRDFCIAYDLK